MWRNTAVVGLVEWLKAHNARAAAAAAAGSGGDGGAAAAAAACRFLGMDVYALHASVAAILGCGAARRGVRK